MEHAPEDTAALRASPPLNDADERARRFLRIIREAEHVPVPPQSLNPLEQRILELERDLTLVSLSRMYRLGKALRRLVERLRGVRGASLPTAVSEEPEGPCALDVEGLPRGTGRPVVFFVPWLVHGGGGERVVSDLARAMVADGRSVAVVVTAGTPAGMLDATAEVLEITPHVVELHRLDERERLPFCAQLLSRSDTSVAVNVGSEWFYENLDELKRSSKLKIVDTLFNHVGHIRNNVANAAAIDTTVAAHRSLAQLLVDYYEVPTDVKMVYIGVEPRGPAPSRPQESIPVVGWMGRLSSEKRPTWFVELARRLGDAARFRLAGNGPDGAAVAEAARGVASLELVGFRKDNIGFIDSCDLMVITSEVEGISNVAMEAISRGIPVLSTDVGGMPDLIQPGVNGGLVPADDFEALVQQVRDLIKDPQTLRELQERVLSIGLDDQFTCAAMLAHFRKILS